MSKWKLENPSPKTLAMREWVKTPKGEEYKKRQAEKARKWRAENRERFKATQKRAYDKVRLEILTHYSGGIPKCACCGESGLPFLTIDHIDGKGADHRREIGMVQGTALQTANQKIKVNIGGNGLPYWLKKNNYPEGFQILCANCNFAKRQKPICPHQENN